MYCILWAIKGTVSICSTQVCSKIRLNWLWSCSNRNSIDRMTLRSKTGNEWLGDLQTSLIYRSAPGFRRNARCTVIRSMTEAVIKYSSGIWSKFGVLCLLNSIIKFHRHRTAISKRERNIMSLSSIFSTHVDGKLHRGASRKAIKVKQVNIQKK